MLSRGDRCISGSLYHEDNLKFAELGKQPHHDCLFYTCFYVSR